MMSLRGVIWKICNVTKNCKPQKCQQTIDVHFFSKGPIKFDEAQCSLFFLRFSASKCSHFVLIFYEIFIPVNREGYS